MPDPTGFLTTGRKLPARRPVPVRIQDWREVYTEADDPLIRSQAGRCMDCGIPFCHHACPLNNLIPDWNDLVRTGDWASALESLHATNNFPEFTGRAKPPACWAYPARRRPRRQSPSSRSRSRSSIAGTSRTS
jgi:glutamate synthase (NADPH/NADH) small chain